MEPNTNTPRLANHEHARLNLYGQYSVYSLGYILYYHITNPILYNLTIPLPP